MSQVEKVDVLAARVVWIRESVLRHVDEAFAIHGEHRSDWPFMASEPAPRADDPAHAFVPLSAVAELVRQADAALRREEFKQGADAGNDGLVRALRAALRPFTGERA